MTPFQNLAKLQTLYLYNGLYNGTINPSDTFLEPLRGLTNLRELYIYAYGDDLSPLSGLTKLQSLSIMAQSRYGNPYPSMSHLEVLEILQDLRTLELDCTKSCPAV